MFLALRELWFARNRFLLMGAVVALISILMVILSGLSSGLVNDGVSALQRTPIQAFAFAPEARSVIDDFECGCWTGSDCLLNFSTVVVGDSFPENPERTIVVYLEVRFRYRLADPDTSTAFTINHYSHGQLPICAANGVAGRPSARGRNLRSISGASVATFQGASPLIVSISSGTL